MDCMKKLLMTTVTGLTIISPTFAVGNCLSPAEHQQYWRGYDSSWDRLGITSSARRAEQDAERACTVRQQQAAQQQATRNEEIRQQQIAQAEARRQEAERLRLAEESRRDQQERLRQQPTETNPSVNPTIEVRQQPDEPVEVSPEVSIFDIALLLYFLASGLIMWPLVRPWFNGMYIFAWGRSFVENFFRLIWYRLLFEILVFIVSCVIGSLGGWIYAVRKYKSSHQPIQPPQPPSAGLGVGGGSLGPWGGGSSLGTRAENVIPFVRATRGERERALPRTRE
jgi:hypothetical protein